MKKKSIIILVFVILVAVAWIIGSGFIKRKNVYLVDYSLSEDGSEITLQVGVAGSMGYVRDFLNDTNETEIMEMQFYSAFGGFNSSIGAKNEFVILLNSECREIYFYHNDGFDLVLQKNQNTGEWERPR
ncbi:hypothetical protein [Tissierella sp.]|uniref:hypothetical protein n=1 Tax=Tissierella sp. TaxID=41274 RepID=UPI00286564BA|nr:hypothetical protein [Tissierella sp.]MDR7855887.1 hypothetical protein [Tissierella sp.]